MNDNRIPWPTHKTNRIPWPTHKTKARHARSARLNANRKARRARRHKHTLTHRKVDQR